MILNALAEKLKRRSKADFKGRHFEATLILQAVSWYLRYPLSYRDIEELFLERGLEVDHSTLNRWVLAYAPLIERRLRAFRRPHCGSIRVDETSYEGLCVNSVLFSADRHRPFSCMLASVGAEVELRAARGCSRQPRIRRDCVHATIPYAGRRSSEASGATLHHRRCQAAHVSSRPPLPRSHQAGPAQQGQPNLVHWPGSRRRASLLRWRCRRLSVRPASAPSPVERRRLEGSARARSGAFSPGQRS